MDALIEERIESFKNELSRIVHAAVEDALEGYRRTLRPLGREVRAAAQVGATAVGGSAPGDLAGGSSAPAGSVPGGRARAGFPGEEWPHSGSSARSEPLHLQQHDLPLALEQDSEQPAQLDLPKAPKPIVDPFWSEAAAAISSPAEVRPAGLRTSPARRSPRELEAVGQQVLECLRERDGETVLGLARALGQPTSELRRPVQLLLAAGAIEKRSSTQGERFFAA